MKRRHHVTTIVLAVLLVGNGTHAYAIFGEEDWLSGQNAILAELLGAQLKEITQVVQLVNNTRQMLGAVNDTLALARTVKRVYETLRTYSLAKLVADAKRGLYRAMPELRDTEAEVRELVDNGRAIEKGSGAFFSRVSFHDAQVSNAARRTFEHGYQATIWPGVFPEAMSFQPDPTPVELLIQERYKRTNDARRRAVQQTALGVLAEKVKTFVEDAEAKDNAELRSLATGTEVNFQAMAHLTEIRNLNEQELAEKEAARLDDEAMRAGMRKALSEYGGTLLGGVGGPLP